jgi:transcriptional regulator with XRE-family HTH domain
MSAIERDEAAPVRMTFADEVEPLIEESLRDPEFRAAYEDETERHQLIDWLVSIRKRLRLAQSEVARRMSVKQPTVSGIETEGSDPRLSTVQRYARAVECRITFHVQSAALCDWLPRSDAYTQPSEAQNDARVEAVAEPVRLWAAALSPMPSYKARPEDFALAV